MIPTISQQHSYIKIACKVIFQTISGILIQIDQSKV